MTDMTSRLPIQRRLTLYWWAFNLCVCVVLLAFAARG